MATTLDELFAKLDELSIAITNEHMRINAQHALILHAVRSGVSATAIDELLERVEIAIDRMNTFSLREDNEASEPPVFDIRAIVQQPNGNTPRPAENGRGHEPGSRRATTVPSYP